MYIIIYIKLYFIVIKLRKSLINASFEEKSVWIQLIALIVVLGTYFLWAGRLLAAGVTELVVYVPLFIGAIVLLVVVLVAGHVLVSIASQPDGRDERDRLIGWRAEANSSWILGMGVLAAICALIAAVENVWIAHLLLLTMLVSEVAKLALQLFYYRIGV